MNIFQAGHDVRRINEIFSILLKYGFGDALRRLGLANTFQQITRSARSQRNEFYSMKPPERARRAMEEMGPTFIKLGQILATRSDLFSTEWIEQFELLQDNAPALDFDALKPQLNKSLGTDPELAFDYIDPIPLGTASIAQVHKATTKNGDTVVLKILKPGTKETIDSDLRLLEYVATLITLQSSEARRYQPIEQVREFSRSLRRELDLSIEARNAERIANNLKHLSFVKIPKIYWEWTCHDLNVQEYIKGISAKDTAGIERAGLNRELIASRGAKIVVHTMFKDGFFHADPHPGNFYVLPNNHIAMLDFGMVGKLSNKRQQQLSTMLRGLVTQDVESYCAVLIEWSSQPGIDFDALTSDVADIMEQYVGAALNEIDFTKLLANSIELVRRHNLSMPADIAMANKAFVTLEGFGRLLNPKFDLMAEAKPLTKDLLLHRYRPKRLINSLGNRALNFVESIYEAPESSSILAARKQSESGVDSHLVDKVVFRLEDNSYNQIQAIYNVGVLIAFTLLVTVDSGPSIQEFRLSKVVGTLGIILVLGNITRLQLLLWWSRKKRVL